MNFDNLLPSIWRKGEMPAKREELFPLADIQQEINRVFDNFFKGFDLAPLDTFSDRFGKFYPSVDVKESDKEIIVTAELPGLEEKDFEVLMSDDTLTIKGEKKEEKEDKGKDYHRMERSFGCFSRGVPLPEGIDTSKVDAQFKNGVLKITLPRTEDAKSKIKKIAVKND